ncbi:MAG TPA: DUF481 domain-containing protein [Bacteroidales bacterium]|nr:DUF481 domain-containing protein [Bacteroidales bacterium]
MKKILFAFSFMLITAALSAQNNLPASDSLRKDALNVYMTANDFLKKEMPFLNYVRDIKDADVYIISTVERTGAGGFNYAYFLVGQNRFKGMADTIKVASSPDDTQDQIRIKQATGLKMGLMRYIVKTPLGQYFRISFTQPMAETVTTDKWNSWVFRASMNGNLNAQQTSKSSQVSGDLSASRVTENWKINLRGRYNYSESVFDIAGRKVKSDNDSRSFNALIVRSITDHWSYGGSANIEYSSYSNVALGARFLPGIEYDLFPYSQSTRRQLRLLYSFGYENVSFIDSTIFNKVAEAHLLHSFNAAYEVLQKWGSIDITLDYKNYLHDWSLNNLSLDASANIRIFRGMSVNFGGGASLIHDQLGLPKQGATDEQILTRQRELATTYSYFTRFGLTFTFGSIYNNVVNPRFGDVGGFSGGISGGSGGGGGGGGRRMNF